MRDESAEPKLSAKKFALMPRLILRRGFARVQLCCGDWTRTILFFKPQERGKKIFVLSILFLITALSAVILFISINPYLYSHPIGHTIEMARYRINIMAIHNQVLQNPMNSFAKRLRRIFQEGVLLGHLFVWYTAPLIVLYLVAIVIGLYKLVRNVAQELYTHMCGPYLIIALWGIVTFILNGIELPMDWGRYYIPFIMWTLTIFGLGVNSVGEYVRGGKVRKGF